MTLRIVQSGNALPFSFPVNPDAEFEPGQIAQLNVLGNNVVCGVSDGTAPIGIIDDIKTNAFSAPSIDETITVSAVGVAGPGNTIITPVDIKAELANPNVNAASFITNPVDVALIPRNGVIVFPAGTELNIDLDGDGTPDGISTTVSYSYQVPNIIGDDSTQGSSRITVWFQKMIASTNKFETNQTYPINSNLFCSEAGLLTTRQPTINHPGIAIVTGSPTSIFSDLEFLWI